MAMILAAPPLQTDLIDPPDGAPSAWRFTISRVWYRWFIDTLLPSVQTVSHTRKVVQLTAQTASINTTTVPMGSPPSGQYRVSWYARVTTAAAVSSSFVLTLGWTESGQTLIAVGPSMAGNTLTTTQTGSIMVESDAVTGITYAVAYTSSGAPAMAYRLTIAVEQVN